MPNPGMNNVTPEQDRTYIDRGFNGLGVTNPATAYENEAFGPPPGQLTHPLVNAVNESSNTTTGDLGPGLAGVAREGY